MNKPDNLALYLKWFALTSLMWYWLDPMLTFWVSKVHLILALISLIYALYSKKMYEQIQNIRAKCPGNRNMPL